MKRKATKVTATAVFIEGARIPKGLSAPKALGRFEKLRKLHGGVLLPKSIVEDARPVGSLLHGCFEWDERKAAESFREDQARALIRQVRIIIAEDPASVPRRAYVNITRPNQVNGYVTTAVALSDDEYRGQVLARAEADIASWRNRYKDLVELADLMIAIDTFLDERKVS